MSSSDMVAPSKESSGDAKLVGGLNIVNIIYNFFKKVSVVGAVYLVGYMQLSVAWLLCPVVLSVARSHWQKENEQRRNLAKATATTSEKEVILARIDDLPAWVFFPDIERAEWLNRILVQVWPNVNHFTRALLKDTIEPNVAASLAEYNLKSFKFERMILGTIAPRIGGVKVYDKNLSRDEIIMDVDLFYAGNCDISFSLSGIKGGIKDFQIHGMVRVVMKPLIKSMPLVGGLQVFFLNNPRIDFNLVGVADVLDMPGFSDLLRRCIVEQVANIMVLPNKLPIKLSDEVCAQDLRMHEPEGVVRVHLVEAKNLMKKDIGMLGKGKSDPYAVLSIGAQSFRTKTIDNNVNPKWDYWCEAQISSRKRQSVEIDLWDWDPGFPGVQNDDFLGRCSIEINDVVKKGHVDTWLTLQNAKHGTVHLIVTWYQLSCQASDLQTAIDEARKLRAVGMSTAVLSIYIDSCKNLPNVRSQSSPDPYLVINLGKKTENSAVKLRTGDPVYEISYTFLVSSTEHDKLDIQVMDQKTSSQIGHLSYSVAALLDKPGLQLDSQPLALQKSGPDSKIILSMALKILKYVEPEQSPWKNDEAIVQAVNPEPVKDQNTASEPELTVKPAKEEKAPDTQDTMASHDFLCNEVFPRPSPSLSKKGIWPSPEPSTDSPNESLLQEDFSNDTESELRERPSSPSSPELLHRTTSVTSWAGEAGRGRIRLTLRYSSARRQLVLVVHAVANIPLKDPAHIPDPYVKIYLLPGRSKDSKRKTAVMKDNCNPVYDERFEYSIAPTEVTQHSLEVTVATQKGFLSGGSPIIGQVIVNLADYDLAQGSCMWFDLLPESTRD